MQRCLLNIKQYCHFLLPSFHLLITILHLIFQKFLAKNRTFQNVYFPLFLEEFRLLINIQNMEVKILLVILLQFPAWSQLITLGENLIQNSDFSQPNISNSYLQFYNFFIPSWNCSNICEIDNCVLLAMNCSVQAIDLSSENIQIVSQTIATQEGNHQLSIQFLLPKNYAQNKTLKIFINQTLVYEFISPQIDTDNLLYTQNTSVYLTKGNNMIGFTMGGINDSCGFRLVSVSLRQQIQQIVPNNTNIIIGPTNQTYPIQVNVTSNQSLETTLKIDFVQSLISFPASRMFIGQLVNLFISFDRLQLYYYHQRNYSYSINIFLKSISNLMDQKGALSLNYEEKYFGTVAQAQENFISHLEYKYDYINRKVLNKSQNGYGFISNNDKLVVYSTPYYLALALLLYILFRITFNFKFSRIFRKYTFGGTVFLLMVFQGNIEQFSFYVFGELGTFFSKNIEHKIVNCFILFFFFILIFCSFALYLWFWSSFRAKIWCFVDNVSLNLSGVLGYTVNRGAICLLLGVLHQVLLGSPNAQLLVLAVCQLLWITAQVFGMVYKIYKCNMLVWLNILEGLLRMSFQLTSYLYSQSLGNPIDCSYLNEQIHLRQILLFVIIWTLQFLVSLFLFIREIIYLFCKKEIKLNSKLKQPTFSVFFRTRNNQIKKIGTRLKTKSRFTPKKQDNDINFYLILKKGKPIIYLKNHKEY